MRFLSQLAVTLTVCVASVHAQSWPAKPVRLIVGVPPGGTTDFIARLVGQKLGEQFGQQVVIENRSGASGNIGAEAVAKAPPDGYTLLLGTIGTMTINPTLYAKLPFDTLRDFAPVSQLTSMPQVFGMHPSLPPRNVRDFVAYAKARPGQINFASAGSGTAVHLAAELFKTMTGTQMVHVPYKGSGPALTDLIGGQVSLMFDQIFTTLPHIRSGKLLGLGVTTAQRSPAAPEIPTIAEAGVPGYNITTWHGILAPAATPKDIVTRLATETAKALNSPDLREKFMSQGADPVSSSPEQFATLLRVEIEKWAKVVKASGAKVD